MRIVPPLGEDVGTPYADMNLETGVPGSVLPAEFFNSLNAEVSALLAAADIDPDEADLTQVLQAVQALIAAASPTPLVLGQQTILLKQAQQSLTLNTNTIITWATAYIDDLGAFSLGMNTRLTVPAGMTKARIIAQLGFDCAATINGCHTRVVKNGVVGTDSDAIKAMPRFAIGNTYTSGSGYGYIMNCASPVLTVAEGDYFEVWANPVGSGTATTSITSLYDINFFSLEKVA